MAVNAGFADKRTLSVQLLAGVFLGQYIFLPALILSFAFTFSQDNPNSNVSFYIVTFPAKYLPYALIFLTFVTGGPEGAKMQITGLIAAHLYDFLTRIWPTFGGGRNYIFTPIFVKRWFTSDGERPVQERGYGTAVHAPQNVPGSTGWTGQRGPGRRLGTE
jgi:Derlin-2/3